MKERKTEEKAITLVALVITIIVLLILAGITINLTIGIITRAQNAGKEHNEAQAREKLEIVLLDMQAEKVTNPEYNQDEYLTSKLEEQDMQVEENIVIVDGWQFEIDRNVPKISASLGKDTGNRIITKLNPTGYTNQAVEVNITVQVNDVTVTNITVPQEFVDQGNGVYKVSKNGTYIVTATLSNGETLQREVVIDKIDTVAPSATINLSEINTSINTNITATVTLNDNESGIAPGNCKWVYIAQETPLGTDDISKYPNSFTNNPEELTLNATTQGTYYLHILTVDNAGNKQETISNAVNVKSEKEVTINGEVFYIIKANESTVTLLAKDCIDTSTLKQSASAQTIKFSSTNYWKNETTYPYELNRGANNGKYDSNITDTSAIGLAESYGESLGGIGRLMTKAEADSLQTTNSDLLYGRNGYSSSTYLGYWLGSANGTGSVWNVYGISSIVFNSNYINAYGVRPVIEISKSLI